jgi:hypothetical protein
MEIAITLTKYHMETNPNIIPLSGKDHIERLALKGGLEKYLNGYVAASGEYVSGWIENCKRGLFREEVVLKVTERVLDQRAKQAVLENRRIDKSLLEEVKQRLVKFV